MARTGGAAGLAIQRRVSVLPSPYKQQGRRLQLVVFEAQYPARRWAVATLVYASDRTSRCAPQDSGSGWIRCSFPVGLFHSRLHAGLSRRTVCPTVLLLHPVVRCFLGDDHVMHVTFAQARRGDPQEARLLLQLLDVARPAVSLSLIHISEPTRLGMISYA